MTKTLSPELVAALRRLRLGRMIDTLPERVELAEAQGMALDELLTLVLTDEIARRDSTAVSNRVADAKLDADMTIERFDKSAKISFDKKLFAELCSLRFLQAHRKSSSSAPSASARPSSPTPSATSRAATATTCGSCAPTRCSRFFARADSTTPTMPR